MRCKIIAMVVAIFSILAHEFTGRSSTMYAYEGIGSIYWHMVAKLLVAIQESVRAGKAFYSEMSPAEVTLVSMVMQAPAMLMMQLGLADRLPSVNTTISNVPGMQEPMYWNGARMDGSYPASIVMDGMALNITLVTYDKNVDFGITACRQSVPDAQRLIDYMEQSLAELEDAAGLVKPAVKARAKPKTKTKPQAKAKAKAKVKPKARAKTR